MHQKVLLRNQNMSVKSSKPLHGGHFANLQKEDALVDSFHRVIRVGPGTESRKVPRQGLIAHARPDYGGSIGQLLFPVHLDRQQTFSDAFKGPE
jgi:hypothetical protein